MSIKQIAKTTAFNREQVDLIKQTVAKGATDAELSLFLYTAQRTGLDPLTKQIHAIKRWDSAAGRETMAIQTGIDGYRLIADRTGRLAGIEDAVYDREDKDHPEKATVTVYKWFGEEKCSFTASARWNEYCAFKKDGTPMALWKKMPYLMLGKCAEALALRKAFPADLTGIYTFEEDAQDGNTPLEIAAPVIKQVSGSSAAAVSAESPTIPTTQPEEILRASSSESPTPKAATRKPKKTAETSNYSQLVEWLKLGGYTEDNFMAIAHRNRWVPDGAKKLSDISNGDLGVFLERINQEIIVAQLDAMPK